MSHGTIACYHFYKFWRIIQTKNISIQVILTRCSIGSKFSNFFHFFSFCSLLNFVTLGFASAVAFFLSCDYHILCVWCNKCQQCSDNRRDSSSDNRSVDIVRNSYIFGYNRSILEYYVNKLPPWLFSAKLNTPLRRKTHAPDSHWWKPLPWFCLLRQPPWTIQASAVQWQLER